MPALLVDGLRFDFQPFMAAEKYDEWQYYQDLLKPKGKKAVDLVAMRRQAIPVTLWLIEAKNFRMISSPPDRSNISGLAQTVANKVADSLVGLHDTAAHASDPAERAHAKRAMAAQHRRIVLHLEPHVGPHSALFPRGFGAGVLQKLKQLVRSVDSNPLVASIAKPASGAPWTVS